MSSIAFRRFDDRAEKSSPAWVRCEQIGSCHALDRAARGSGGGFTLVELLVVIAIIGVLIALLLPAIQATQESSRRATCANQLKQHSLAVHGYIDARQTFPLGRDAATGWAWSAFILPFNDGEDIYSQLDFNQKPGIAGGNRSFDGKKIPNTRCPSARAMPEFVTGATGTTQPVSFGNWPSASYHGNFGPGFPSTSNFDGTHTEFRGIFGQGGTPVKLKEVPDGLSKTFLLGESSEKVARTYALDNNTRGLWLGWVDPTQNANSNGSVGTITGARFLKSCHYQLNRLESQTATDRMLFGSMHPNGAQFSFCDGAVKFVRDDIQSVFIVNTTFAAKLAAGDVGVYQLLACRNDGRAVDYKE